MGQRPAQQRSYYSDLSKQLFKNVCGLFEQVVEQFALRSTDENAGARIAAFSVYTCGLYSAYLCKHPSSMFLSSWCLKQEDT